MIRHARITVGLQYCQLLDLASCVFDQPGYVLGQVILIVPGVKPYTVGLWSTIQLFST